uniref:Uncharacterized protein n=1 Tax=Anguilla anguilla TaxID=7936 RepID=A0A0E9RSP0_ANGAN
MHDCTFSPASGYFVLIYMLGKSPRSQAFTGYARFARSFVNKQNKLD